MEWKQNKYWLSARRGPWHYQIDTTNEPAIYAIAQRGVTEANEQYCTTIDEAKRWCESHYRTWYASLPVPTPEGQR